MRKMCSTAVLDGMVCGTDVVQLATLDSDCLAVGE